MDNSGTIDEETTLLPQNSEGRRSPTRLPKAQIAIVLLLQLCEPVVGRSISPYINKLVSGLDIIGGDERKVGYYTGLIQSLFFLTEAIAVMQWSRLSDRIGRKPVLLFGLVGASLSTLLFGLSRTFWTLVISRCLCGLLNGNTGVMGSAMGDLTDSSNRAQAFSFLSMIWATGSSLGPLIGGSFARPHERFPGVFTGQFWVDYPYFLPCVVVASFVGFAFIVALLFLKEPVAIRELLVYRVLISVFNYMTLAFLDIMLGALLPLFLAMLIEIGGLGFEPSTIGYIIGVYGLCNGIFQVLCFAPIVRRFGTRSIFVKGIMSFVLIYALFPVMNVIARHSGVNAIVWSIIILMICFMSFMDMAYGCIFMYVTASSPNKHSLGATNGLSQTSVSLARTLGPAISTSLFALSAERNLLGGYAVYVILGVISCLAVLPAVQLPEQIWEEKNDNDTETTTPTD
ncbi:major facilitator superfamily domain-containing protein [Infundibulicybe gibba]|nr:major facilitator superfamily domain-containing protein [Infundibulicybe gibba]